MSNIVVKFEYQSLKPLDPRGVPSRINIYFAFLVQIIKCLSIISFIDVSNTTARYTLDILFTTALASVQ